MNTNHVHARKRIGTGGFLPGVAACGSSERRTDVDVNVTCPACLGPGCAFARRVASDMIDRSGDVAWKCAGATGHFVTFCDQFCSVDDACAFIEAQSFEPCQFYNVFAARAAIAAARART